MKTEREQFHMWLQDRYGQPVNSGALDFFWGMVLSGMVVVVVHGGVWGPRIETRDPFKKLCQ